MRHIFVLLFLLLAGRLKAADRTEAADRSIGLELSLSVDTLRFDGALLAPENKTSCTSDDLEYVDALQICVYPHFVVTSAVARAAADLQFYNYQLSPYGRRLISRPKVLMNFGGRARVEQFGAGPHIILEVLALPESP